MVLAPKCELLFVHNTGYMQKPSPKFFNSPLTAMVHPRWCQLNYSLSWPQFFLPPQRTRKAHQVARGHFFLLENFSQFNGTHHTCMCDFVFLQTNSEPLYLGSVCPLPSDQCLSIQIVRMNWILTLAQEQHAKVKFFMKGVSVPKCHCVIFIKFLSLTLHVHSPALWVTIHRRVSVNQPGLFQRFHPVSHYALSCVNFASWTRSGFSEIALFWSQLPQSMKRGSYPYLTHQSMFLVLCQVVFSSICTQSKNVLPSFSSFGKQSTVKFLGFFCMHFAWSWLSSSKTLLILQWHHSENGPSRLLWKGNEAYFWRHAYTLFTSV